MTESHGSTQEWQLAEELFLRALELDPSERLAFIANLPVADAIRSAVLKRLAGHDTSFMLSSLTPELLRGAGPHTTGPVQDAPWMALPADAPYRVGDAIGRDAVASRFHARTSTDGAPVILTFLPAEMPADPAAQDHLRAVQRRLHALQHPHIGVSMDCGDTDEGQLYLVQAGDAGETLARRLRRVPPLSNDERGRIVAALRAALSAAHDAGIVHGQLRPEWVMVASDGAVQLHGFGVATLNGTPTDLDADERAFARMMDLLQG